jgi:hypothetical protein
MICFDLFQIALVNPMRFTSWEGDNRLVPVDQTFVNFRQRTGEYQVQDISRALPQGSYYWQMPREFLGERVRMLIFSYLV